VLKKSAAQLFGCWKVSGARDFICAQAGIGAGSSQVNKLRYGIERTCACRDDFLVALPGRGMSARDIHANVKSS
jgi:hypothetical protein